MINKQNNDKETKEQQQPGYVDTVKVDVQCHIIIKDKDSGEVIVNKRG